ncbi:L-serine ammonia-lyase, iron-sulfur-dependent, subunit alpha [bacterium]|nr:L-serine ammonia-lyase, iron-sulfur-dependent, subunit alpha [bacterium]
MNYEFRSGQELCRLCREHSLPISEIMLRNEMEQSESPREMILAEMRENLAVMRSSISAGLNVRNIPRGLITGGDAIKLAAFAEKSNMGASLARIVASSMAVVETNKAMGRIVAAPTAGAGGILPAVLIECGGNQRGFDDDALVQGLFTAGAIGCIVAENASIAGASGGCQAETGTAAAMSAGALAELCGADPETVLHAAAIAIKNCLGLVCDPVAGLVECPCIKRNAIGAVNAILSCDMALAGITSLIPFDEVVEAMQGVSHLMSKELRETAKGGLAATDTAKRITEDLKAGKIKPRDHRLGEAVDSKMLKL